MILDLTQVNEIDVDYVHGKEPANWIFVKDGFWKKFFKGKETTQILDKSFDGLPVHMTCFKPRVINMNVLQGAGEYQLVHHLLANKLLWTNKVRCNIFFINL